MRCSRLLAVALLHEEEGREREPARTSCHRLIDSRQACSCLVPFCKWRSCNIPTTDVTANLLMRRPLLLGFPPDFFLVSLSPTQPSSGYFRQGYVVRRPRRYFALVMKNTPMGVRLHPKSDGLRRRKKKALPRKVHNEADWRSLKMISWYSLSPFGTRKARSSSEPRSLSPSL